MKAAVEAGATDWTEVHAHNGCEPNCGKCECDIAEFIKEARKPLTMVPEPRFGAAVLAGAD